MIAKKVKAGMSAKGIATLHYELLLIFNKEEWIKPIKTLSKVKLIPKVLPLIIGRKQGDPKRSLWLPYTFKQKDELQSSENHIKLFFHRLNKDGE